MKTRSILLTWIILIAPSITVSTRAQVESPQDRPDRVLVDAVQQQDFDSANALLKNGQVDVNTPQADGSTALAWAVHWDHFDTAENLIRAGANVNTANDLGVTPLMLAAHNGSISLAKILLNAGASPNASRSSGDTALMLAARVGNRGVVKLLTSAGANPNATTASGHTALMWAAAEKHADVAQALLDEGAALVDVRTEFRRPPQRRRYGGQRKMVLLREGEAANPAELPRDGDGDPPRTQGGFTPLLYAVLSGDLETVRVLVDGYADVNEAAPDGVSALMLALTKRHEELALFLIERGADPNYDARSEVLRAYSYLADGQDPLAAEPPEEADDFAGYTALHVAAATGQHAALRALLARDADPNARMDRPKRFIDAFEIGVFTAPGAGRLTQVGSTPFMLAAKTADPEAMRILAEAGADPFATTEDGTGALMLATGLGKRAATDVTYYKWNQHNAIEASQVALELGIDINAANEWGETALHGATYHAADDLIRFLVDNGADIDATDWENQTPLRLAKGHMICCTTYVEHPQIADVLLKLGAAPEAGQQVTFGLLGYHSENKDDSSPITNQTEALEDPR